MDEDAGNNRKVMKLARMKTLANSPYRLPFSVPNER